MKKLFYFVYHYPFSNREYFPDLECVYLSKVFDEVYLVPRSIPNKRVIYELPINVKVDTRYAEALLHSKSRVGELRNEVSFRTLKDYASEYFLSHMSLVKYLDVIRENKVFEKYLTEARVSAQDILYSFWMEPFILGARCRPHVFSRAHGFDVYWDRQQKPFLQKKIISSISEVHVCSKNGQNFLKKKYPDYQSKVLYSPLGINSHSFMNPCSKGEVLNLVSCGSLIELKRFHLIPQALKHVKRKVYWTHFGEGPEMQQIHHLIKELPANVSVNLMGHVQNKEIHEFYKNTPVDAILHVSRTEGIPVSLMEAMSYGIEPWATDVGGVGELVPQKNLLHPYLSTLELSQCIENILISSQKNREEYKQIQEQKFDATKNFTSFAQRLSAKIG